MITLHSSGGLGNQMFNYAAARTLADRHGTQLLIDASSYRNQWHQGAERPFLLDQFPVRAKFRNMGPLETKRWIGARFVRRLREDAFATRLIRDAGELSYCDEFSRLGPRAILNGHFIDPRFFAGNAQRIRQDLGLSAASLRDDGRLLDLLGDILESKPAVAVHIRRGDLLAPENSWLRLPGMEKFYQLALSRILQRFPAASLFIFSDDPEWCRAEFKAVGNRVVVVSSNESTDIVLEFFLLTQCDHFVIANSAFSWWGAWLSASEKKQVLYPFRWDTKGAINMEHFTPSSWERIEW